jgi:hypothetical protein
MIKSFQRLIFHKVIPGDLFFVKSIKNHILWVQIGY